MLLKRALLGLSTLILAVTAVGQLTPREKRTIDEALTVGGFSESQLSFGRRYSPNSGMPLVDLAHTKPLEAADILAGLHQKSDENLNMILQAICEEAYGESPAFGSGVTVTEADLKTVIPLALQKPVLSLVEAVATSNNTIRNATSKLSAEEKRALIESLPQWAALGVDINFEFITQPRLSLAETRTLLAKVDLKAIRAASILLAAKTAAVLPALRKAAKETTGFGSLRFVVKGVNVELSDQADDIHAAKDTQLCIDLGGQNKYTGRYGAGIGYTGLLIDFGNKTSVEGTDATVGVGLLGVGIAQFEGRGVNLKARNLCFGVGLAGVGALSSQFGTFMESKAMSQGVGMYGIGICRLSVEDDRARVGYLGQGAGLAGGVGWMINPGGNDQVYAGGQIKDGRFPNGKIARAQAFASGIEQISGGLAGGLGLLTDRDGDDTYTAGTESQSYGEWGGSASLFDGGGDDRYLAQAYSQACAQQSGAAYLFDLAGSDSYTCQYAAGQSSADDGSTAMLMDRSGDDLYTGRDSQPGSASRDSLALLFDFAGSNRVSGRGLAPKEDSGLSVRIFTGTDTVATPGSLTGTVGKLPDSNVVTYAPEYAGESESPGKQPPISADNLDPTEINRLFKIAQDPLSSDAGTATKKLALGGDKSIQTLLAGDLTAMNQEGARVIAYLVVQAGATGRTLLTKSFNQALNAKDDESAASIVAIGTFAQTKDLEPSIKFWVDSPVVQPWLCRYAVALRSTALYSDLVFLALNEDSRVAREGSRMISELCPQTDLKTLEGLCRSGDWGNRSLGLAGFRRYAAEGITFGKKLLTATSPADQLLGIELLGSIGTPESLRYAATGLNATQNPMKLAALAAINGRVPEAYRNRVLELQRDPNPLVSAVAKSTLLAK